jgi:uncharacterized membrane protein YdjX (TVP38/TMEM64 family)
MTKHDRQLDLGPGLDLEAPVAVKRPWWRRWLPLAILLVVIALAFAFDLHHYLSFETLRQHEQTLRQIVEHRPILTAIGFVLVYAAATAVSLPGAAFLTIAGGFLFGIWLGTLLAVTGATAGAIAIFLIAKTSLGDGLKERAGPWLKRMQAGFNDNALSYLLVLRLIPAFPFWIVNIVPAFLGVKLRDYAVATFFGIMPGGFVYASVGNGLGAVIEAGDEPDLGIILEPAILLPILGLALLALLPVAYRKLKGRRAPG